MRNERMAALLAAEAPAGRDCAFQLAVMEKIERRRFRRGLILNVALTVAATVLLALVMPALDLSGATAPLSQLASNTPVMAALLAAAFAWHYRPRAGA
jgi:hypothetical protein